jgi:hypothetical protein
MSPQITTCVSVMYKKQTIVHKKCVIKKKKETMKKMKRKKKYIEYSLLVCVSMSSPNFHGYDSGWEK